MGLFNKLFRSYDFESMDEVKQIELIDGLGISDLREDTESIKERMGLLEQNLDKLESSLHWRDNIITGDVALARVKEKEVRAVLLGYVRPSTIKRTRKRGIEKAKFMDHTSYEWSQWWKKNE